jgi:PhnB protein
MQWQIVEDEDARMTTPPGFATVTPYFFMENAPAFIRFLIVGLDAEHVHTTHDGDGRVANAQLKMGNMTVMVSEAGRGFAAMPASYYLYVANADAAMARAIAAGGEEIMPVADMPYGDRQGGVRDGHGNIWWISQRLVPGGYLD